MRVETVAAQLEVLEVLEVACTVVVAVVAPAVLLFIGKEKL
jgi:hypothetical protein